MSSTLPCLWLATMWAGTIPYHTIQHYTIPYHTIQHNTIPYHTSLPYPTKLSHVFRYMKYLRGMLGGTAWEEARLPYHLFCLHTIWDRQQVRRQGGSGKDTRTGVDRLCSIVFGDRQQVTTTRYLFCFFSSLHSCLVFVCLTLARARPPSWPPCWQPSWCSCALLLALNIRLPPGHHLILATATLMSQRGLSGV